MEYSKIKWKTFKERPKQKEIILVMRTKQVDEEHKFTLPVGLPICCKYNSRGGKTGPMFVSLLASTHPMYMAIKVEEDDLWASKDDITNFEENG